MHLRGFVFLWSCGFTVLPACTGNSPWVKVLKLHVTSMNDVVSHFPSPLPLWALTLGDGLPVRKRAQLLALTWGGHQPHSSSVKPAVALQLLSPASQVGFGQDGEATSTLKHCHCLAVRVWDLAVLSDAWTVWSQQSASYVNYVLELHKDPDISTFLWPHL